jgi:ribosomal protein S18 acetylase RimI-like enzyme
MTDLLGVCVSWSETACVIQPEDGAEVSIPLSLIVSGKPVPPRPSVRQRVSPRAAESHAAPLWPAVVREPLGDWELRTDPQPVGRLLKRANSCLAMGDPGVPFVAAADAVVRFYSSRDRDPLVQVEAGSSVEGEFLEAGWSVLPNGEADFLLASVARVRRGLRGTEPVELAVEGARATASVDDVATGRAALDGDWLGLHDLRVAPEHRRRGHALAVLSRLLEWGAEQGATTAWLHVETDNVPALALYESVGFAPHHTCRYLSSPPCR